MAVEEGVNGSESFTYDGNSAVIFASQEIPAAKSVQYEFRVVGRAGDGKTGSWVFVGACRRETGGHLQNVPVFGLDIIKQINLSLATLGWSVSVSLNTSTDKIEVVACGGNYSIRWRIDGYVRTVGDP